MDVWNQAWLVAGSAGAVELHPLWETLAAVGVLALVAVVWIRFARRAQKRRAN